MVGKFSSKLEKAASSYQLSYINKLIQILLEIPHQNTSEIPQQSGKHEKKSKKMNVNLVTFKVSDLIRCKFSMKEQEMIRIYRLLQRISETIP